MRTAVTVAVVASSSTAVRQERRALQATVALSALSCVGAVVMAVAHLGVAIPVVSALGPGGTDAVPPAAAAFAVGAAVYALLTVGLARTRPWSWPVGLVVNALALLSFALPYRGVGSLIGIIVATATLALLLSPPVRRALLPSR